jgi:hypothetical protein
MKIRVQIETGDFLNRRQTGFSSRSLLDREQMEMTHEEGHVRWNFQAMPDVLKFYYQLLYAATVLQY